MAMEDLAEKQPFRGELPLPLDSTPRQPTSSRCSILIRLALAFILYRLLCSTAIFPATEHDHVRNRAVSNCRQFAPLVPGNGTQERLDSNKELIFSAEYRTKSVGIHSGLVQIKSESFDDNGPVGGESGDPRWEVFFDISEYLKKTFSLVHERLNLTRINTHGLIFEWRGSDASLKPMMLMAHQDTVPVNPATIEDWTHPPWSGHYDGTYVWGRGAVDCKNTLSGTLEAVTLLLEASFVPRRTVLLAYGFDEESKGWEGAGEISKYFESVYGKDGIAFIVDEGGLGIGETYGRGFAMPATGEKGYLDVNFTLHTPGGHSSVPPPHTGIGILSSIISTLESSPYSPSLSLTSPIFSLLQCAAEHSELPKKLKKNVGIGSQKGKNGEKARKKVANEFAKLGRGEQYLVSTSQAVDVIVGGVKVNALPELSYVVVNHRISVDSQPQAVYDKIVKLVKPIAKRFDLDLDLFGETAFYRSSPDAVSGGQLKVFGINELSPAPISLTSAPTWEALSGTIQHIYAQRFEDGLVVSPALMTGNTDTRFMWNLTKDIYRFTPMDRAGSFGLHTVDEHMLFDDHIGGIWFFHELIRNADAASFE